MVKRRNVHTVSIIFVLFLNVSFVVAFNVGVWGTACSLDQRNYNDPCKSLYEAICDGAHCKCPSGSREAKFLKRCIKAAGKVSDVDDLQSDYVLNIDPHIGKKLAGGGAAGVVILLCKCCCSCFRNLRCKLPFSKGNNTGGNDQMQQQQQPTETTSGRAYLIDG